MRYHAFNLTEESALLFFFVPLFSLLSFGCAFRSDELPLSLQFWMSFSTAADFHGILRQGSGLLQQ